MTTHTNARYIFKAMTARTFYSHCFKSQDFCVWVVASVPLRLTHTHTLIHTHIRRRTPTCRLTRLKSYEEKSLFVFAFDSNIYVISVLTLVPFLYGCTHVTTLLTLRSYANRLYGREARGDRPQMSIYKRIF